MTRRKSSHEYFSPIEMSKLSLIMQMTIKRGPPIQMGIFNNCKVKQGLVTKNCDQTLTLTLTKWRTKRKYASWFPYEWPCHECRDICPELEAPRFSQPLPFLRVTIVDPISGNYLMRWCEQFALLGRIFLEIKAISQIRAQSWKSVCIKCRSNFFWPFCQKR